eukprot:TRINITY_DN20428_c1_g1_i1.p1 TRINITY_DN20428_c1_g1~~TRINITY_DN20428_c1_g1_i1.p1  ORF type:complete len:970 (-),score=184.24 TRINITY_DN20428_c1_g1_i1:135-3044(-)
MTAALTQQLLEAEKELCEKSGAGSASSEDRDNLKEKSRKEEQFEGQDSREPAEARRPSKKSGLEDGQRPPSEVSSTSTFRKRPQQGSWTNLSSRSGTDAQVVNDRVGLALLEAKRAFRTNLGAPGGSHPSAAGSAEKVDVASIIQPKIARVTKTAIPHQVAQTLPQENLSMFEGLMQSIVARAGEDLAEMQASLDESKESMFSEAKENAELRAKLMTTNAQSSMNSDLQATLVETRNCVDQARDERDDLEDKLNGLEVLVDAKMQRCKKDIEDMHKQLESSEENMKRKADFERAEFAMKLELAAKEAETAKTQVIKTRSERTKLEKAEVAAQKQAEAEIQSLKAQLMQANLQLSLKEHNENGHMDDLDAGSSSMSSFQETLMAQERQNQQLAADYERLRLQILENSKAKDDELASLKAKAEVKAAIPLNIKIGPKSKKKVKGTVLTSITEDDDEDMLSQACSGVSGRVSDDAGGVGDLRDFDDYEEEEPSQNGRISDREHIQKLRKQLEDSEAWYKDMEELKKASETQYASKVSRLCNQMVAYRDEASARLHELERLKAAKMEIEAERDGKLTIAQTEARCNSSRIETDSYEQVNALQEKVECYASQVLELAGRLSLAQEQKRYVEQRLDDMRRQLHSNEERHAKAMADLRTQVKPADSHSALSEQDQYKQTVDRIKALEEERNVLRGELEARKVVHEAKLEQEEREGKLRTAQLDEEKKRSVALSVANTRLMERIKLLEERLANTERASPSVVPVPAQRTDTCDKEVSLLQLLRCPARFARGASMQGSWKSLVWQVLNSVDGLAALSCRTDELLITGASKRAIAIWGSSSLRGTSLLSLFSDMDSASIVRSEIIAPSPDGKLFNFPRGCWVRDLGHVELRNRMNATFEASLICVNITAEASTEREASVLVIISTIEKHQQEQQQTDLPVSGRSQLRRHTRGKSPASCVSSVGDEDVAPDDSVSNVDFL